MVQQSTIQLNVNVDDQNWSQKHVALMQQLATSQPGGFLADAQKALTATGTADVTNPAELAAKIAEFERVGEALGDLGLDLGKLQMQINQGIAHFSLKGTTPVDESKLQAEQAGKTLFDGLSNIIPGGGLAKAFKGMGMLGVGVAAVLGIGVFVKNMFGHSQIMSTYMGAFMKIFGHFIDVLLLPLLPLFNRVLIWLISEVLPFVRKMSEWIGGGVDITEEAIAGFKQDIADVKENTNRLGAVIGGKDPDTGEDLSIWEQARAIPRETIPWLGSIQDIFAPDPYKDKTEQERYEQARNQPALPNLAPNFGLLSPIWQTFSGLVGRDDDARADSWLEVGWDKLTPWDTSRERLKNRLDEEGNYVGPDTSAAEGNIIQRGWDLITPWSTSREIAAAQFADGGDSGAIANLSPVPFGVSEPNMFRGRFSPSEEFSPVTTSNTNIGEINFFVTSIQDIKETIESARNFISNDNELKTAGTTTFG